MPPLKSARYIRRWLETNNSTLPFTACLTTLEEAGVRTDHDLLLQSDVLAGTPAELHRHIKALRMLVLDRFSSPGHTAADLLHREEEQPAFIKSGIPGLDGLLNGGLPMRQVTEICAKEAHVATQLAIEFAAAHLLPEHAARGTTPINNRVYYIQSGSLSLWRAEQAVSKRLEALVPAATLRDRMLDEALERLFIVDCSDVDALLTFLHGYADEHAEPGGEQEDECSSQRDLLIIDSIRPLIVAVLQRQNDIDIEVHAVKTALREIASAQSLASTAVLITNGVSQRENSRIQPSLGSV
ncbi:DNA repair protein rad51d, partial [Coemansia aciculifera]